VRIFLLSEPRHGWIDITFGQPPDSYTLTASDVPNDCLRDLAAAVSRLLAESMEESVQFSLEPDFATCRLHRDADSVRVVLRKPGQEVPAFDATFPLREFAEELRGELLRIEPRYSAEDGWTQPFPHREVANLA
jgi:hypothetical protein